MYEFDKWITLKWEKEVRLYFAHVKQNLFKEWYLRREWGSKENNRIQSKSMTFDGYDSAIAELEKVKKVRKKREYIEIKN